MPTNSKATSRVNYSGSAAAKSLVSSTSKDMRRIGAYEILDELGRGGMGVVYRGYDPALNRPVAIKVIRMDSLTAPDQKAFLQDRLIREARSAGSLSHPGIVTVYHIGQEEELAYIVMQFVAGLSFEKMLAATPAPDWQRILFVLRKTAAALDYAHSKGVIHRDVKPANVLIDQEGEVKICDFGIAKTLGSSSTHTGFRMGSPTYMSPEQVRGDELDGRSDQYSLAAMTYLALTGSPPFQAERLETLFFKIVMESARPADELNPRLGPETAAVIDRGLSKQAQDRFPSCAEFITALERGLETARVERDSALSHARNLLLHSGPKEAQAFLETQTLRYIGDAEFDSLLESIAGITHIEMEQQLHAVRLQQGTQAVQQALDADQWKEAKGILESLEQEFPGEPLLIPLAIRIEQVQRKAAAEERMRVAVKSAWERLAHNDFPGARRTLLEIEEDLASDPEVIQLADAIRRAEEIDRQRRQFLLDLQRALETGRGLIKRGEPRQALAYLESEAVRFGEEAEFKSLVSTAIEALRIEEEQRQREEQLRREAELKRQDERRREEERRQVAEMQAAAALEAKRADEERRSEEEERRREEQERKRIQEQQSATSLSGTSPPDIPEPVKPQQPPVVWQIPEPHQAGRIWVASTIAFLGLCFVGGIIYLATPARQKTDSVAEVRPPASTAPAAVLPPQETRVTPPVEKGPIANKITKGKITNSIAGRGTTALLKETKAVPAEKTEDTEWNKALASGTASAFEAFLRAYPSGAHGQQAIAHLEQLEWNALQPQTDPNVWRAFLAKYPSGTYVKQASAKIEDLEWGRVNPGDAPALSAYIQSHPKGAHTKEAETLLAGIGIAQVTKALDRYAAAINKRDEKDLQAVWPHIPQATLEQWRRDFQSTKSIEMRPTATPSITINGQTARADCNYKTTKSYPGNSQVYASEAIQHITLRKDGTGWVIESIH